VAMEREAAATAVVETAPVAVEMEAAAPKAVLAGAAATAIDDNNTPIVEIVRNSPATNPPRTQQPRRNTSRPAARTSTTAEVQQQQQQRRRNTSRPAARTNTAAEVQQQQQQRSRNTSRPAARTNTTAEVQQPLEHRTRNTSRPNTSPPAGAELQQLDHSSDGEDVVVGDYSSPASNTRSKGTRLATSYYNERDADEDSEEEFSLRSDYGSDDDDEEDPIDKLFGHLPDDLFHQLEVKTVEIMKKNSPERMLKILSADYLANNPTIIRDLFNNPDALFAFLMLKAADDLGIDIGVTAEEIVECFNSQKAMPKPKPFPFF